MTTCFKRVFLVSLATLACAQTDLTQSESWGYGILTGFSLSLVGFLAAIILVCIQKCVSEAAFKIFVNMLYALGCGAIVGDAIIHILPQAFTSADNNPHLVSLVFICSVAFFIIIERIFESCGIVHEHWGDESAHGHAHGNQKQSASPNNNDNQKTEGKDPIVGAEIVILCNNDKAVVTETINNETIEQINETDRKVSNPEDEEEKSCLQNLKGKGSAGYLNLLSSFIHNFFDGFAIGVGFASGKKNVIIPVIVAIFAHEIPRQMGDVGILLKSGFTGMQTVLCNGCINFMSLFGVLAGLGLGSIDTAAQNYVMVFVAGNFIYIGADIWKHLLRNKNKVLNIVEFMVFALGVGAMYLVLLAESEDTAAADTQQP